MHMRVQHPCTGVGKIPLQIIPVTASFFSCLGASVVEQVSVIQEDVSPSSARIPNGDLHMY